MMIFAVLRHLAWSLAAIAFAVPAAAQTGKPRSPQVMVAVDFLRKLEGGQGAAAQALLDPAVARIYPAVKLAESARQGKLASDRVRQLRYEAEVPPEEAFANQLRRRFAGRRPLAPAYVVCMADVPASGYGLVSYVTVILVASQRSGWQVSEFRYQSEPDHLCPK